MAKGKEFVDATIASGKVVVFSKTLCPYCKQTKKIFDGKKLTEGSLVWIEMENRDDMNEMQDYLKQLTGARSVVVFSKSYCPFCKQTKSLLNGKGLKADGYVVVEIENRDDVDEIQDYLQQLTGARSVPRVFIAGKSLGGNDDTQNANKSGKLDTMLKEAGAL